MYLPRLSRRYDVDGSGCIDLEELRAALRKLGLRGGQLETAAIFRRYDSDDSGEIDLKEFAVLVRDLQLYTSFDTNFDGEIDASELHQVLERLKIATTVHDAQTILDARDRERTVTVTVTLTLPRHPKADGGHADDPRRVGPRGAWRARPEPLL